MKPFVKYSSAISACLIILTSCASYKLSDANVSGGNDVTMVSVEAASVTDEEAIYIHEEQTQSAPVLEVEHLECDVIYEAEEPEPEKVVEEIDIPDDGSFMGVSKEEIELLALVTMAEAEGECEEGKRLVIDSVLNRVSDSHFPDTITDVIWYPNAYSSMWNGRVDRCYVMDDIVELVKEELQMRTNYEVLYFTSVGYSSFGTPMFQLGNHYFSKE